MKVKTYEKPKKQTSIPGVAFVCLFFSYLSKFCHLLFFSCSVFKWYMYVYANNYTHRNLVMIVEKRYLAQIFTTNQE